MSEKTGRQQVSRSLGVKSGAPEAGTAQAANPFQVFDKQVERASREMKRGFKSEFSHKIGKKLRDEFRVLSGTL